MLTDTNGEYRLERLPAARYRVQVQRIGYVSRSIDVELSGTSATRLSFGLEVRPVVLPALEVTGQAAPPFLRVEPVAPEVVESPGRWTRLRPREFLVTDARELTYAEVVEAVTLGETDLFRAIQRVPGVSTRDDYTATLWTRGALWDQTRVYFDGLPLYNPTHAGWLFSAVNPDAIGAANFLPGGRPARWGEGAAAVLDIASRRGGAGHDERIHGLGELSLASVRLALDGSARDGRFNWMVAGRRTYVDVLSTLIDGLMPGREFAFPYDFADVIGRLDARTESGWTLEASSILEYDHLRGDLPGLIAGNRGTWGNRAGRVSVTAPLGSLRARVSVGSTRFSTSIVEDSSALLREEKTLPGLENSIEHTLLGAELGPETGGWELGYQLIDQAVRYDGRLELIPFGFYRAGDRVRYSALWGEKRWDPFDRLAIQTGLRLEVGDEVSNAGAARLAPRLAAEYRLSDHGRVSAAWSRSFQYTQDISPAAGPIGPQLYLSHWWVLAKAIYPAVRADVVTAGIEQWIGDTWALGANGYYRGATGVMVPNPSPGPYVNDRDPDAMATNHARGLELSAQRAVRGWTARVGYALGFSDLSSSAARTEGGDTVHYEYAAPADVRHTLDAVSFVNLGERWRLGGAFTYGSGAPYTRLVIPRDGISDLETAHVGQPNADRTPAYASLDLMAEYSRRFGTWRMTAYAQLRNVLDRRNAVTYGGSRDCGIAPTTRVAEMVSELPLCDGGVTGVKDHFQPGLPRMPLIGVRVAF